MVPGAGGVALTLSVLCVIVRVSNAPAEVTQLTTSEPRLGQIDEPRDGLLSNNKHWQEIFGHKLGKPVIRRCHVGRGKTSPSPIRFLLCATLFCCGDVEINPGPRLATDVVLPKTSINNESWDEGGRLTMQQQRQQQQLTVTTRPGAAANRTINEAATPCSITRQQVRRQLCPACGKGFNVRSRRKECPRCERIVHERCVKEHPDMVCGNCESAVRPQREVPVSCQQCDFTIRRNQKAVLCSSCRKYTHLKCTYYNQYHNIVLEACNRCSSMMLPQFVSDEIHVTDNNDNDNNVHESTQEDILTTACMGKGLHFIHLNARSILSKISEIKLVANKYKPTVLGISETWLDSTINNSEITIEGYDIIRHDRNRRGGGVCLYINNKLAHKTREDLLRNNYETLWVDLLLPNTKHITVGVCYRPPDDNTFLENFDRTLSVLDTSNETIILGDMNICYNNESAGLTKQYKQILAIHNHKQIITTPTRVTENTANILDHIICNRDDKITHSGVIETGISDHFMTYCTRKHQRNNIGKHRNIKIRSLRNYNIDAYRNILQETNWDSVYGSADVNEAWINFKTILTEVLDEVAPWKEIRIKNRTDPWISNEILHLIEYRDTVLRRLTRHKNDRALRHEYNRVRNKLARDLKSARSDYFCNKTEEHKHEPRKLWKHLKATGYRDTPKEQPTIVLNIDGETCHDTVKIANYFNSFFTTIAATLAQNLPLPFNKYTTNSTTFQSYYRNKGVTPYSFILMAVSPDFTFHELRTLKADKSTGPDKLPARFLRDGAEAIAEPLTHIINMSIMTDTVPNELKEAIVTPLFKKGDKLNVSNYRPVSILCIVSKILERAVYIQVEQYLRETGILYMFQSGFRGMYSTETCLIHLLDYIRIQMAKGHYTGMVLLDLQKAFDTVDHSILCNKLEAMGIGSTNWFRSYLSGRCQKVKIGDTVSESMSITCGVPQGSILGPLLFLCYVNDMPASIKCKLLLYADDSVLLVSDKDPIVISNTLTKELEACREWLVDNRLSLHLGKTEAMLCGTKRKIKSAEGLTVKCMGTSIASVSEVKYLGIMIDETLSGEGILNNIVKKCTGRIKFLYRQAGCLPTAVKKTLCQALIQCHLDYAISSWYVAMSQKAKQKLQIIQNKMVRFILDLEPRTHISVDHMKELDMLKVPDRAKQMRLNNAYKIYHGLAPAYLQEGFVRASSVARQQTRNSQMNFSVPNIKGAESGSFFFNTIKDWNSLPNDVKASSNVLSFKKGVKNHLQQIATEGAENEFIYQ